MITKWYLEARGYGKGKYYIPKKASGKKLEELEKDNTKLFDSREEAKKYAWENRG